MLEDAHAFHSGYLRDFVERYRGDAITQEMRDQLNIISSPSGAAPPLLGEVHATRMIALLCGLFKCKDMKDILSLAFEHPETGFELELEKYHSSLQFVLKHMPVYPEAFQAQIAWLFEDAEERNSENVETITIPAFGSRMTPYDQDASYFPVDTSAGVHNFEFLVPPYGADLNAYITGF